MENVVRSGFVIYGIYYVEVGSRYDHFLKGFLSEMGVGFCQRLFPHLLRGSYGIYSSVCITLMDLWILENTCIPGINPT